MHIIILLPLHNVERTTSRHSKSKNIYISREKSVRKKKKKIPFQNCRSTIPSKPLPHDSRDSSTPETRSNDSTR